MSVNSWTGDVGAVLELRNNQKLMQMGDMGANGKCYFSFNI